jgi:uncharacterized protein (DUF58 family)
MAHFRACIATVVLAALGVLLGRVDVVVLATPLAIVAIWSILQRPRTTPTVSSALAHHTVREGEATRWSATMSPADGVDVAVARLAVDDRWQLSEPSGIMAVEPDGSPAEPVTVSLGVRSVQWGQREIGPGLLAATSSWGAFRVGPTNTVAEVLTTLPLPTVFDSTAAVPSPAGLIGLHRSRRRGDGTEFATIRPFTVGDRLRRINWPVSLRTGALHVATTYTDSDTDVLLVVDATVDAGTSGGLDGEASSLDRSVRGAGAIAAHFLRHGDGVALRTIGSTRPARIRVGTGTAHLRRVLGELALIEPGMLSGRRVGRTAELARLGFQAGGLAIVLSPLLSTHALEEAVALARHGLIVLVVDTFPERMPFDVSDPTVAMSWRIRMMERVRDVRFLEEVGVPVVAWRGPGTVDQVLRDLGRRAAAPRLVQR